VSAQDSRFIAVWASAEHRARVWFWLCLASAGLSGLSLVATIRAHSRPREVIRIGCDGIPEVVRIEEPAYSDPSEREIRAFAAEFAEKVMRRDSYSVRQDFLWAARRMAPELQVRFKEEARGTTTKRGAVEAIEALAQRTQVEPSALEIKISKETYPWRAEVKGVRKIVGREAGTPQPFELRLELVRASRNELIEGLLVWQLTMAEQELVAPVLTPPHEPSR
jgi:hypothetical protein